MKNNIRLKRKIEHIYKSVEIPDGPKKTGFDDVTLIHQALPGVNWDEIDTSLTLWGKTLSFPMIINAITGGPYEAHEINKNLAQIAKTFNIGIAVGSQTAGIEIPSAKKTFEIVRKCNPNGLILSNVSANSSYKSVLEAIEMIEADAVQLHLNVAQEIFMNEGDRNFSNIEENIAIIVSKSPVPVVVKEVGFGISRETAVKLHDLSVEWIDVGGSGGTNFIKIESDRSKNNQETSLVDWGIPTAASILEIKNTKLPINIIASGGIRNGHQLLKALALGAVCGTAAGPFLKNTYNSKDITKAKNNLLQWIDDFKKGMLLTGCRNLEQVRKMPFVLSGFLKEWVEARKS